MRRKLCLTLSIALLAGCIGGAPTAIVPASSPVLTDTFETEPNVGFNRQPSSQIGGMVSLQGPVVGAKVRLLDASGVELPLTLEPTTGSGWFGALTPDPLTTFTVVVSGGESNGVSVTDELRADVAGYGFGEGLIVVNPVTTLIAAYRQAHPELNLAQATHRVRTFLGFEATDTIDSHIGSLDMGRFLAAANEAGGLKAFIADLVRQMDAEPSAVRSFAPAFTTAQMAPELFSAAWTMDKLGSGLAGAGASVAVGYLLKSAGFDPSGMNEINAKLDQIINQLNALQESLNAFQAAITADVRRANYDQLLAPVNKLIAANQTVVDEMAALLAIDPKATQQIDRKREDIRNFITRELYGGANLWHQALAATTGTSLMEGLSRMSVAERTFYNWQKAEAIQRHWEYFDAQQAATILILYNYNNMDGDNPGPNRQLLEKWASNRKVHLSKLRGGTAATDTFRLAGPDQPVTVTPLNPFPSWVVVDLQAGLMWAANSSHLVAQSGLKAAMTPYMANVERDTGLKGWRLPDDAHVLTLIKNAGGSEKSFAKQLENIGITLTPPKRIYANLPEKLQIIARTGLFSLLSMIYADGRSAIRSDRLTDQTNILLVRPLEQGETYWY